MGTVGNSNYIIIKKVKKVSGDGHHGGAWKVAYADFVTAMMAFFLLMWLLNATTEDQRKGIADYFNPSVPVSPISGGGSDLLNGATVFSEETLARDGTGGAKAYEVKAAKNVDDAEDAAAEEMARQTKGLEELQEKLLDNINDEKTKGLLKHIQTRVTPEGLVIELVDTEGEPLFEKGASRTSPTLNLLLEIVSKTLTRVANDISIVGHTDSLAYSNTGEYSNWDLSTDRAHRARRIMIKAGYPTSQISEVAGKADTEPLVEDRYAPQNRRISITILRK